MSRHKHSKHKRKHTSEDDYIKKRKDGTSNRGSAVPDETFWKNQKSLLAKLFFTDDDIIKKGSTEYDEFWDFLHKYYAYNKLKNEEKDGGTLDHRPDTKLNFPSNYNQKYRINLILTKNAQLIYSQLPKDHDVEEDTLSEKNIEEFSHILQLYINFLQKQKFLKLCKLRKTQKNLPIHQYKDELLTAVKNNQIVIIAGDTGCGKSTQVPQYLVNAGWKCIACTQPRRIACTSLCHRVAYETLNEYGSEIGYQIRFEKNRTKYTRILFLTEGLLLRQVATDPLLSSYNVIILDEVHERHLHSDFLMGIMKCLAFQRQELKVILMSATINIELFTQYFENAPVIQVPGRLYPIALNYFPISKEERNIRSGRINPSPYLRIMQLIDQKYPESERGDLLIFLSGISEISTVVEAAKIYAQQTNRWIILSLHSTLSVAEQDKVFDYPPEGVRKCIVSTNIAETSVTIDGIRFVVDSGKVKEMNYDLNCRMQRLQEFWISKASSEQRKGRAGRTGPGVCYRLYSETDYNSFDDYSLPEIQRVPLDSLILQMISMGLPNARKFPFIEPPVLESIENSIINLKEQAALNKDEQITVIGQLLSRLPVDISIGKMLIMGTLFGKIEPILLLAAGLSIQSPFTNQAQRDLDIMAARRNLESAHGDPFTLLNAYNKWLKVKTESPNSSRKWCRRHGLEEQRFYEMTKLRHQFKQLLEDAGLIKMLTQKRYLSSAERSQRHGEVKQLQQLKREARDSKKKRKILKLEVDDIQCYGTDDDEDVETTDIKAIDFQLSHDKHEIQNIAEVAQNLKNEDIILLKIVLCSGLYPSLALADEFNSYKTDVDQLFHTKAKHFVVLHPLSGFSLQPDVLKITDADILQFPGFEARHPVSNRHQLLLFMSLLETTKPYLVNNTRVPALQSLLLFSSSIDTNEDFSRLIFDSWIEVKFPNPADGQDLIMQTLNLRDQWMQLLQQKFDSSNTEKTKIEKSVNETDEIAFTKQLINFMMSDIFYSIHRLLAADLHDLYLGYFSSSDSDLTESFFGVKAVPHKTKGGFQIRDFIVYNCLQSISCQDYLQNQWTCPFCETSMFATTLQKMEHEMKCSEKHNKMDTDINEKNENQNNPNKKTFYCEHCAKELHLTAPEILLHKKQHTTKT